MRVISGIIGIVGAIFCAMRGFHIRSQLNSPTVQAARAFEEALGGDTSKYVFADFLSMITIAAGILGVIASLLILTRTGPAKAMAFLLIVSGLMPLINVDTFLFGIPLIVAGITAAFIRKKAERHGG